MKLKEKSRVLLGLAPWWELRPDHPFTLPAGLQHDASDDAVNIYLGKTDWCDLPNEPDIYKEFVKSALADLMVQIAKYGVYYGIKRYKSREVDKFHTACRKVAIKKQSSSLKIQAEVYPFLIRARNLIN